MRDKGTAKHQELFLQTLFRFSCACYIHKHTLNGQQILMVKLHCILSQVNSCVCLIIDINKYENPQKKI